MEDALSRLTSIASLLSGKATDQQKAPVEEEVLLLFNELHQRLLRYLGAFRLSPADAEEIAQDSFLALYQHLRRGRSRENLRGWLFRVAHNLALRRKRDEKRGWKVIVPGPAQHLEPPDPGLDPEDLFAASEEQRAVQAVVRVLSDQDRQCLFLRAEGLRYREIAEVLDLSISTISLSLGRTMARITRALEKVSHV